jgi:hypothetical protein
MPEQIPWKHWLFRGCANCSSQVALHFEKSPDAIPSKRERLRGFAAGMALEEGDPTFC